MDEVRKIKVTNLINTQVLVILPELHFKRTFPTKGASILFPYNILEEAIYEPGFQYMIEHHILFIDDKQARVDLGLEDEETTEAEVKKHIYTDAQMLRLLKVAPISELEENLRSCSKEQRLDFADFAIANKITDLEKCDMLTKYSGINVLNTILLNKSQE